jgi:diguanylate cyclase (GGDEF)-like protein
MFTLQRGALMRDLEAAAAMDAKTGLLNAIAWEHLTERELSRAQREGYPLAVLIVDIDRFKSVNDRFGHLVGDQVLRRIGRAIATELRGYDGVARFGGEEFVAVLPDVGAAAALTIADRVRQRISTLCVSDLAEGVAPSGDDHPLSVSIGVSSTSSGPHEVGTLLRVADAALYEAKAGGRNRVVLGDTTGGSATQLVC